MNLMKNGGLSFIKIVLTILIIFIVLFGGYQLYKYQFLSIKSESAVMGEMEETVDSVGIFFRNELPLTNGGYQYLDVIRAEGERVAAGGTVARVYADERSAKVRKEIRDLEERIHVYEEVLANSGTYQSSATGIDMAIYDDLRSISSFTHLGQSVDALQVGEDLLVELMKKKISSGDLVSYDTVLKQLKTQLTDLKANTGASLNNIESKKSGYFSLVTDGLEEQLSLEYLAGLTVENFDQTVSLCEKAGDTSNHIGKMVYDNLWTVALKVPTKKVDLLEIGDSVDIRIPAFGSSRIGCTVADIRKEGESCVLVLSSSLIGDNVLTLRAEEICLVLKTHNGIQVRQSALRKVDGEDGVYIKVGPLLRYKKVKILYSDGTTALLEYDAADSSGIRVYDQVVYRGSNLHDRKAVT